MLTGDAPPAPLIVQIPVKKDYDGECNAANDEEVQRRVQLQESCRVRLGYISSLGC